MYNFYIFYIEQFKVLLYLKDVHGDNIPTINCTIIALQTRTITVNLYSGTLLWVLNGTETNMSYGNTYTAEVLPGTSVVFELKFNGKTNVLYVQESSNEACIPNVIFSWDEYRAEFIMPDEDISCIVSSILEPT